MGSGKWEMSATWTPSCVGNATPYPLSTGNCRGPKCQLEIHQSNTPQMEREGCRVLCVFTAKLTEIIFSLSRHNWETGNGKLDRGRFRCEAEKARPEKPERSTEGQAGLRARRRVWPSVSIGLMPIIRVVLVGQSREALVTAQRPARGDRLITSSAYCWTMGPGRRSVQPDHRRTPKAAVPWGGSFCFPLMAPLSSQLRPASRRIPISRFPFPVSQGKARQTLFSHTSNVSVLMLRKPSTVFFKISRLGRFRSQFPVSPVSRMLAAAQHPISHSAISHFPFPTWPILRIHIQFPISHFPLGSWQLSFGSNFPFPVSTEPPILSCGSTQSISHFPFPTALEFEV